MYTKVAKVTRAEMNGFLNQFGLEDLTRSRAVITIMDVIRV